MFAKQFDHGTRCVCVVKEKVVLGSRAVLVRTNSNFIFLRREK